MPNAVENYYIKCIQSGAPCDATVVTTSSSPPSGPLSPGPSASDLWSDLTAAEAFGPRVPTNFPSFRLPDIPDVPVVAPAQPAADLPPDHDFAEIDDWRARRDRQIQDVEQLRGLIGRVHPHTILARAEEMLEEREPLPPPPPAAPPRLEVIPGIPLPDFVEEPDVPGVDPDTGFAYETPEEVPPAPIRLPYIGTPGLLDEPGPDPGEAPWTNEPDLLPDTPEEEPMDLAAIATAALGGAIRGALDFDPRTPGIVPGPIGTSLPDLVGGIAEAWAGREFATPPPSEVVGPPLPPGYIPPANQVPTLTGGQAVGCISQRDVAIAQMAGTSPEMVDRVLAIARRGRRRRRRLVTQSDLRDIAAMKQVIGGGKAFETWLAKSRV